MLSFLIALGHRWRQPAWLAVLFCYALTLQAAGATERPGMQTSAIAGNMISDHTADSAADRSHATADKGMAGDQAAYPISKAAIALSKLQLTRRIVERWGAASLVTLTTWPLERSLILIRPVLKVFDASSPEYLTLRQLRL